MKTKLCLERRAGRRAIRVHLPVNAHLVQESSHAVQESSHAAQKSCHAVQKGVHAVLEDVRGVQEDILVALGGIQGVQNDEMIKGLLYFNYCSTIIYV